MQSAFIITGNGHLTFSKLNFSGSGMKAISFVSCDSNGLSDHYSLVFSGCMISNFDRGKGCRNFFTAYKSMVADSIVVQKCSFSNNKTNGFMLNGETDNKGYYSAEKIELTNNQFSVLRGILLSAYRGGTDENTMGPKLLFTNNRVEYCHTMDSSTALIELTGAQQTNLSSNTFINCNPSSFDRTAMKERTGKLIHYTDFVRANHIFQHNSIIGSGAVHINKFVNDKQNTFETNLKKYY